MSSLLLWILLFTAPAVVVAQGTAERDDGELLKVLEAERPTAESLSRLDVLEVAVVKDADEDTEVLLKLLETEQTPPESLLPEEVKRVNGFEPGDGAPVGVVQSVQGDVLVVHGESGKAYTLEENAPIFNKDILVTGKRSRVSLLLHDKSALTLSGQSKLLIDRSSYLPSRGTRDTNLQLFFGRVRAVVSKLPSGKTNYKVKTPTAVVGVRGTDFVVAVLPIPVSDLSGGKCFVVPGTRRYAAEPPLPESLLMTAVVTGRGNSTVDLADTAGRRKIVGPMSISKAISGAEVDTPVHIGPAAPALLQKIAPQLGRLSMPPRSH